jgi:hypothetical protein
MVHGPGPPREDGVADYVAHLLEALAAAGTNAISVPVRPPAPGRWAAATVAAARTVRQLRPDVVHVQFAPSAYRFSALPGLLPLLVGGPAAGHDRARVRLVGGAGWVPGPVWRPVEALRLWDRETGRLVPASRAVVVTNPAHAALVRRRSGARPVEIPLAANVADAGAAAGGRSGSAAGSACPTARSCWCSSASCTRSRASGIVLEALPALRADRPDLHLVVAGGFTSQALPEAEASAFRAELASWPAGAAPARR